MIAALLLLAQLSGPDPTDPAGKAVAACSKKIVQLAMRQGNVKDLTSVPSQPARIDPSGYVQVEMRVTINYVRGSEKRQAVVNCTVGPTFKVVTLTGM